ncbi:MAG: class I SAM-dependent methyltransferase [Acidobacteriota bacterium]
MPEERSSGARSRRSAVPRGAEPRKLPAQNLALLDDLALRLRPEDPALDAWVREYHRNHRRRLAADLWLAGRVLDDGARVLEYGAVPLLMTGALAATGYRVDALDIAPQRFASSIAELGLKVSRCDVEREAVPFEDDSFDAVLFNELFEHLRIDPIFTLEEVLRVLRPGGLLLLSTPNLRSFRGLRNLLLHDRGHAVSAGIYRQYEKLQSLGHMGHVREYTVRDVAEFLGQIGFSVERVVYRGGHGRGAVGLAERLLPSMRPFFSLIARKPSASQSAGSQSTTGTSEP